jgi:hypothetical protein
MGVIGMLSVGDDFYILIRLVKGDASQRALVRRAPLRAFRLEQRTSSERVD